MYVCALGKSAFRNRRERMTKISISNGQQFRIIIFDIDII